jgi:hypothetical protein
MIPDDYNFYVDANQEQLEALPEIDYRDLDFTTRDWDVRFRDAWQNGVVVTDQTPGNPGRLPPIKLQLRQMNSVTLAQSV